MGIVWSMQPGQLVLVGIVPLQEVIQSLGVHG
jgi:hypothetical protein